MVYITFVIAVVYCIFVGLIAMDTLFQLFADDDCERTEREMGFGLTTA
jgi:hypothetical protein